MWRIQKFAIFLSCLDHQFLFFVQRFLDVEILLEKKATEDQEAKARKLKLPLNFYLYEQSPPCPGCRGCEKEDTEDKDSDADSGWLVNAIVLNML